MIKRANLEAKGMFVVDLICCVIPDGSSNLSRCHIEQRSFSSLSLWPDTRQECFSWYFKFVGFLGLLGHFGYCLWADYFTTFEMSLLPMITSRYSLTFSLDQPQTKPCLVCASIYQLPLFHVGTGISIALKMDTSL